MTGIIRYQDTTSLFEIVNTAPELPDVSYGSDPPITATQRHCHYLIVANSKRGRLHDRLVPMKNCLVTVPVGVLVNHASSVHSSHRDTPLLVAFVVLGRKRAHLVLVGKLLVLASVFPLPTGT